MNIIKARRIQGAYKARNDLKYYNNMVRERMIKHNKKDHMMKRTSYLPVKYPETGKD